MAALCAASIRHAFWVLHRLAAEELLPPITAEILERHGKFDSTPLLRQREQERGTRLDRGLGRGCRAEPLKQSATRTDDHGELLTTSYPLRLAVYVGWAERRFGGTLFRRTADDGQPRTSPHITGDAS